MTGTTWRRAKQVFHEALERTLPERVTFLAAACGDDRELRAQVEGLLAAYDEAGDFLASPTLGHLDDAAKAAAGVAAAPAPEGPGSRIGPYKLLERIGEGGFGVVYMAEQKEPLRRRVALKVIKLGMDTREVVARFESERQALALMDHPNIARVFDAGATETGRPYFVMELVKGVPVVEYCDENRLSTRERLRLFTEICGAVHHAHQKGVIHRDLKPSNVLVTLHDGVPVPKVIDFGVAKAVHRPLTEKTLFTRYGQFIGTPEYMSPEQAEMSGLDVDTRSDVYALGVLLYELLTGTTPFDTRQLRSGAYMEVLRILREEDPPRPSTRLSTLGDALTEVAKHHRTEPGVLTRLVRGDLDWIAMKALEKDRTRRYDSASALARDITRHLEDEPVTARPPSAAYRLRKLVRKHRGPALGAAAVLSALAIGGATALWQGLESHQQAERARASAIVASARAAQDPVVKALLIDEVADVPDVPGWLAVLRDVANHPLPDRLVRTGERHNNLTYSADGRYVAATLVDGSVRVWRADAAGMAVVLRADGGRANGMGFNPDASRLVVGYDDGSARIWNTDGTGEPTRLGGHGGPVYSAGFDDAGDRVITRSADGIRVWPAGGGEPVVLQVDGVRLHNAELSPDGGRILAGGSDGAARIWPADGSQEPLVLRGHGEAVWAEFSHDGTLVVTGSSDGAVRIWRADGAGEPRVLPHPGLVFWQVNFSDDDGMLVTGSTDGTARVWDPEGGAEPVVLPHFARVLDSKPTGDGSRVLTAASDGRVRLWRPDRPGHPVVFAGPPGPVGLRRAPDDSHIVGAFSDGTIRTWRLDATGEATVLRHDAPVRDARFSPDGTRIVTAGDDGLVRVWPSAATGAPILLRGHSDRVFRSAFGPEGLRLVTASRDGTARIWRIDGTGEPLVLPHDSSVYTAVFSPDGSRVVTGSQDGAVRLWAADGQGAAEILHEHRGPVYRVAFAPDGLRILSASGDGTTRITSLEGGRDAVVLRGLDATYTAAFSPDGQRVVTASGGGDVRIWAADGSGVPTFLSGHQQSVSDAAFSGDGTRVVTASSDGTARVWPVDGDDEPLVLRGHQDFLWAAGFSPDGTRAITASHDGTVRIWRVTGPGLREYLRENVRACLTPDQRVRYLGEATTDAEAEADACEQRLAGRIG